jgi:glucuronosyltransferase
VSDAVSGFVSHCGANSLAEAAAAGVPLVCIPLFGDQFYNAAVVEFRGTGITLDHGRLTRADLVKAIRDITDQQSYARFFC